MTAIFYPSQNRYVGLSGDSKPTSGVRDGTGFLETDTQDVYEFQSSSARWLKLDLPVVEKVQAALAAADDPSGDNPFATLADVGEGGSADFSAVGEDVLPADDDTYDLGSQAKRWKDIYLSEALNGVVPDYSMGSGQVAGVQSLIRLLTINPTDGPMDVIQIGDPDGPLAGDMILDPYWNTVLALMNSMAFKAFRIASYDDPDAVDAAGYSQLDPYGLNLVSPEVGSGGSENSPTLTQRAAYFTSGDALEQPYWNSAVIIDDVPTGKWHWENSLHEAGVVLKFDQDGVPSFPTMPISASGLAVGSLWCDTGAGNVIKQVTA